MVDRLGEPLMIGLSVVMICIIMLVVDRLREGDQTRANTERLRRLEQSTFGTGIALRPRPGKSADYEYLWGGYTGNYHVYNPSYKPDKEIGETEIVKIFVRRYQNPLFVKAEYLFLTSDHHGLDALETFRRLMAGVKQVYPGVVSRIEVRQIKEKAACSAPEIYLGERQYLDEAAEPMCVLELKGPTSSQQHGVSRYYFVIRDTAAKEYLLDQFKQAWNDESAREIEGFWDS